MGRTALSIGANTFQFFTRNPRGSKAKAIDPADVAAFLALAAETNSARWWPTRRIPSIPAPRMSTPGSLPA